MAFIYRSSVMADSAAGGTTTGMTAADIKVDFFYQGLHNITGGLPAAAMKGQAWKVANGPFVINGITFKNGDIIECGVDGSTNTDDWLIYAHAEDSLFEGLWSLSTAYEAGEYVDYQDAIYRANSDIASGTPFVRGTGADEWTLIGKVTDRYFADALTVAAADVGNPTEAEIQAWVTAQGAVNAMVYYTGTNAGGDKATYVYHADAAGDIITVEVPASEANDRIFASLTDVAPALNPNVTLAEMQAFASARALTDTVVFYTGTDSDADEIDKLYHVDKSGTLTEILQPQNRVFADETTISGGGSVDDGDIETFAIDGGYFDTVIYYTGTDDGSDDPISVFHVDKNQNVTKLLEEELPQEVFFVSDTSLAPATPGKPTADEIQSWGLSNGEPDSYYKYTGTDLDTDETTYLFLEHESGEMLTIETPSSVVQKLKQFIAPLDIAAASWKVPTQAEVEAYVAANSLTDKTLFYTGTASDADEVTYVFDVDAIGEVTMIEKPVKTFGRMHLQHDELTGVLPTDEQNPTLAEVQAYLDLFTGVYEKSLVYYTGTDSDTDATRYAYHVDENNVAVLIEKPSAPAVARVFADETSVAPVNPGNPTEAEIAAFASANAHSDTIIYYTGSDNAADEATYVFHVDTVNNTTLIQKPNTTRIFLSETDMAPATATEPTFVEARTWITAQGLKDAIIYYTGTDISTDESSYVYHADSNGAVTVIEQPSAVAKPVHYVSINDVTTSELTGMPTDAMMETYATANGLRDIFIYLTGTFNGETDQSLATYYVDVNGRSITLSGIGHLSKFVTATALGAADVANPTVQEFRLYHDNLYGARYAPVFYLYNGTDSSSNDATHTIRIDANWNAVKLHWPSEVKANDRVFIGVTSVLPADVTSPTQAEIETAIAADGTVDTIFYYNGTDLAAADAVFVYHVDASGNVTRIEQPIYEADTFIHMTATDLGAADIVKPTLTEVQNYVDTNLVADSVMYYTADDVDDKENITYVYRVDASGDCIEIENRSSSNLNLFAPYSEVLPASVNASVILDATQPQIEAINQWAMDELHRDGDYFVSYTGTNLDTDEVTNVYYVDKELNVVHVEKPSAGAKDRMFAAAATVSASDIDNPTVAEMQTFATANDVTNRIIYYTGTNTVGDEPTYVYHTDNSGVVTLVEKPSAGGAANDTVFAPMSTFSPLAGNWNVKAKTYAVNNSITDAFIYINYTDVEDIGSSEYVFYIDQSGESIVVQKPDFSFGYNHISTTDILTIAGIEGWTSGVEYSDKNISADALKTYVTWFRANKTYVGEGYYFYDGETAHTNLTYDDISDTSCTYYYKPDETYSEPVLINRVPEGTATAPANLNISTKTNNYNFDDSVSGSGSKIASDTSAGSYTTSLPNSTTLADGFFIEIFDASGTWDVYNLNLVQAGGGNIDGAASPFVLDVKNAKVTAAIVNAEWVIYAQGYTGQ